MAKWYLNDKFLDQQFTELKNYVFFDFETTGWRNSDPDAPVQTGVYYYQNNKWVCDLFYTRPNCTKAEYLTSLDESSLPRQTLEDIAVKVWDTRENYLITEKQTDHYLLREWIIDYEQLTLNFKTIFNNKIVIAYNGLSYDQKILEKLLNDYHVQVEYNMLDPYSFFRYNTAIACAEDCDNLKQATLGILLNVPNEAEHNAFGDILQLKGIFEKVIENCKQQPWFLSTMTIKDVIDHLNEQKITISGTKKYELPPISQEQAVIVQRLLNKKNVLVNAVAGSGKTTTALYFAKQLQEQYPKKRILMLMYNHALCDETDIKRKKLQLNNLKVSTIHSYAFHILNSNKLLRHDYYNNSKSLDLTYNETIKFLLEKLQFCKLEKYDYFIFDEMQDTTIDYLAIFKALLKANPQAKVLVLGDKLQTIYKYNGAAEYVLTDFDKLCHLEMEHWQLSTSFRLPIHLCNVLNTAFLKSDYLHSTKEPEKKDNFKLYIVNEKTQLAQIDAVVDYICEKKLKEAAKDDDFFILLPTHYDKGDNDSFFGSHLDTLINHLVDKNIKICHDYNDNKNPDTISKEKKNEWKNKVAVTTYYKVKGCERKYVILWHFDVLSEYGHLDPVTAKSVSNPHYVALTRAKEELLLVCREKKITRDRNSIVISRSPALLNCNSLWPYVEWNLLKPYLIKNTTLTLTAKFFKLDNVLNQEFYNIEPSTIGTRLLQETLFKIAQKIKQHGLMRNESKAKLNIQNSLTTNENLYYHNNIAIINAFWLLLRYQQITNNDLFQSTLQTIRWCFDKWYTSKNSLEEITKQLFLKYGEPYLTNKEQNIKKYIKWKINQQVRCLAVFYALKSGTYEWMQINEFDWLNDFQQDQALKTVFGQFDYPDPQLEVPCYLNKSGTLIAYSYGDMKPDNNEKIDQITEFFKNHNFNINACLDLVTKTTLFEFKYESSFKDEDYLQSALYLFMVNWIKELIWLKDKRRKRIIYNKIILLNYTNGTYFELPYDQDFLNEIVLDILNGMKEQFFHNDLTYDEFQRKFENTLKKYNIE